jgi:ubiquinone/menaquinone biosynthesis C-methylase UbiE
LFKKADKKKVPPYTVLADIYDFVMNHVNYKQWAKHIYKICEKHNVENPQVLDISCGTGKFCLHLSRKDISVAGMDNSPQMVKRAKERFVGPVWCGDMRRFFLKSSFNVIVSLYDSMNYLMTEKDWDACLASVSNALQPAGIFVFDISTLYNSKDVFQDYVCKEKNDMASYTRKSYFDDVLFIQTNEFKIRLRNRKNVIFYEKHIQKIRELATIDRIVKNNGFEIIGKYSDFSFLPVSEKSERVHYVLKK